MKLPDQCHTMRDNSLRQVMLYGHVMACQGLEPRMKRGWQELRCMHRHPTCTAGKENLVGLGMACPFMQRLGGWVLVEFGASNVVSAGLMVARVG